MRIALILMGRERGKDGETETGSGGERERGREGERERGREGERERGREGERERGREGTYAIQHSGQPAILFKLLANPCQGLRRDATATTASYPTLAGGRPTNGPTGG